LTIGSDLWHVDISADLQALAERALPGLLFAAHGPTDHAVNSRYWTNLRGYGERIEVF
jgi:hypothetical protein